MFTKRAGAGRNRGSSGIPLTPSAGFEIKREGEQNQFLLTLSPCINYFH